MEVDVILWKEIEVNVFVGVVFVYYYFFICIFVSYYVDYILVVMIGSVFLYDCLWLVILDIC